MSYTSSNKLGKFIRAQKDQLPTDSQSNVVYKIICGTDKQTGRFLNTRIMEQESYQQKHSATIQHSVITDHRISLSYKFDSNGIEISDTEKVLNKTLISEMINIQKTTFKFADRHGFFKSVI